MSTINLDAATERLTRAIFEMGDADLIEIYNEIFPEAPLKLGDRDISQVTASIRAHFEQGLEPEEVVDLWNVTFPDSYGVYYNEEDQQLYYEEHAETSHR